MSYMGLLLQTGLLATWTRQKYDSTNAIGEQVTTRETIAADVPCRKQLMRAEDLVEAGIATDLGTVKWFIFLPLEYPTGTLLSLQEGDRFTVQDSRMQNAQTYFNIIAPANAVEENHHIEIIAEEIAQKESAP